MSNDLNKWPTKQIPDKVSFKLSVEEYKKFTVQIGNRNHFNHNKLYEQKDYYALGKEIIGYEREQQEVKLVIFR